MSHNLAEKKDNPSVRLRSIRSKIFAKKFEKKKLIHLGELMAKAGLDHLDAQTLYGALLTIKEMTELQSNLNLWKRLGAEKLDAKI